MNIAEIISFEPVRVRTSEKLVMLGNQAPISVDPITLTKE